MKVSGVSRRKGKIMAKKMTVKLAGKKVTIDPNRPKVAKALAALVEACSTPMFKIGMTLEHENGTDYQLISIKTSKYAKARAYLVNTDTGRARNSSKVVTVQGDFHSEDGLYVEDLPCEKDKFFDPENPGEFIDI